MRRPLFETAPGWVGSRNAPSLGSRGGGAIGAQTRPGAQVFLRNAAHPWGSLKKTAGRAQKSGPIASLSSRIIFGPKTPKIPVFAEPEYSPLPRFGEYFFGGFVIGGGSAQPPPITKLPKKYSPNRGSGLYSGYAKTGIFGVFGPNIMRELNDAMGPLFVRDRPFF